ncbi:MAG: hypothetical protein WDN44_08340 [Sphingomonas sp.]
MVASRYRPQQWLIGPDVFPFYLSVLRIVTMIVVALTIAVGVARALFGDAATLPTLFQTLGGIWPSFLASFAIVTIVFAVMERAGFPADHLRQWKPEQLPDVRDKPEGNWEFAFEIAGGAAFLLWWTGVIRLPYYSGGADFRLEPAPIIHQLYWPILALAAARLVGNLIEWVRPRWKAIHRTIEVATALGGIALLATIYRAGHWAVVTSLGMPAAKVAELDTALNLAFKIAIVATGVVWTLQCLRVMWRWVRPRAEQALG